MNNRNEPVMSTRNMASAPGKRNMAAIVARQQVSPKTVTGSCGVSSICDLDEKH
jgi:hypothetical protein